MPLRLPPIIFAFTLAMMCSTSTAFAAETITVQSFLAQKEKWPIWAQKKTPLTIDGRYEGRVARQFRLSKFPLLITPSRITALPPGIQNGERMTVSGLLKRSGTRYAMEATRIAVGRTDHERMAARVEKLGDDDPELWYPLADEYSLIAEFYRDNFLKTQVQSLRQNAFKLQRQQSANDSARLASLIEKGTELGIDPDVLAAIRFESIVSLTKTQPANVAQLEQAIKSHLPGWDQANGKLEADVEQRFLKDPAEEYEFSSTTVRAVMHRRLYRRVHVAAMLKGLQKDGSNGLSLAETIQRELPEEQTEISRLRDAYIDFRVSRVARRTQRELAELTQMMVEFGREAEQLPTVQAWLAEQDKRLSDGELSSIVRTAADYDFAYERWKQAEHKQTAIDLLKRAWIIASKVAPVEADNIAKRLEHFGWTRLKDVWMTSEQVAALPADDIELAMKEMRVVVGMKADQVIANLGQPQKKIRVISARMVEEIWIYGDKNADEILVHMQRSRRQSADEAVATSAP